MSFSKIKISGIIELKSGLHIGASNAFSAIGATDSPVIKDPITNEPIIPGSSLKGKIRTLLARYDVSEGKNKLVKDASGDSDQLSRLFGNSSDYLASERVKDKNDKTKKRNTYRIGRLIFRDAFLSNKEELENKARTLTEVKFENTIDRINARAMPRQIERTIKGSQFAFEIIYEARQDYEMSNDGKESKVIETTENEFTQQMENDFKVIADGLCLLEQDYLGGSGSRGYGKVKFQDITVNKVFGDDIPIDFKEIFEKKGLMMKSES